MGEIMEVFDDIKSGIGDKGFYLIIGGAALIFIVNLLKDKGSEGSELQTVTAVASYPDAVTNANVIIDSLQKSIDYSEGEIIDAINAQNDFIGVGFEATNNYIQTGLESIANIEDKVANIENVSSMTYYEVMLHQGRDGYISYEPERALSALENAGVDTSKEKGTTSSGKLNDTAGSKGGGWTTFAKEDNKPVKNTFPHVGTGFKTTTNLKE